jgi:hypothetical protein
LAFSSISCQVKYDLHVLDERLYLLSLDKVGFDKFAVCVDVLLLAAQKGFFD